MDTEKGHSAISTQKNAPGKPFEKGNGGRPKGTPNKNTKALKDMILGALDAKGGQQWLEKQMDDNPSAFMSLIGKVLPVTLQGGGENGEIVVSWQSK